MCNRKRALNLFHCRMQLTNVISSYNFYFERKHLKLITSLTFSSVPKIIADIQDKNLILNIFGIFTGGKDFMEKTD